MQQEVKLRNKENVGRGEKLVHVSAGVTLGRENKGILCLHIEKSLNVAISYCFHMCCRYQALRMTR